MLGILFAFLFLNVVNFCKQPICVYVRKGNGRCIQHAGIYHFTGSRSIAVWAFGSFFHDPFGNCSCVAVSADHLIIKTGVLMLRHSRFHFHNHM